MGKMKIAEVGPTRAADRQGRGRDVLVINSYAGSLLIAAKAAGANVIGSYEDAGFGSQWQAKNFPELKGLFATARRKWTAWGERGLDGVTVVAHPPCAAFSNQAVGQQRAKGAQGLASDHFKCTVDVANYALGQGCDALLVESVQGALEGARPVHDELADAHGYHVFRVLQNAATFGLPQWRPRFWAVFVRKDLVDRLSLVHEPVTKTIGQLVAEADPGPGDPVLDARLVQQREFLVANGLTPEQAEAALTTPGRLLRNLQKTHFPGESQLEISSRMCLFAGGKTLRGCKFLSKTLNVLDPDGAAGVILSDSWLTYQGRNLTPGEYRAVMGFPRDYVLDGDYALWLSKGVCPPVAEWLLGEVLANVARSRELPLAGVTWCEPGAVADFQVTKAQWEVLAGVREAAPEPARGKAAGGADRAVAVAPGASVRRSGGTGGKRRVVGTYVLSGGAPEADVRDAFLPAREGLVLEPLLELTGDAEAGWTVRLQYEPPNKGGHAGDVDRIAERGVKWLRAKGHEVEIKRTAVETTAPTNNVPAPRADGETETCPRVPRAPRPASRSLEVDINV